MGNAEPALNFIALFAFRFDFGFGFTGFLRGNGNLGAGLELGVGSQSLFDLLCPWFSLSSGGGSGRLLPARGPETSSVCGLPFNSLDDDGGEAGVSLGGKRDAAVPGAGADTREGKAGGWPTSGDGDGE